jgi:hypothetical protein
VRTGLPERQRELRRDRINHKRPAIGEAHAARGEAPLSVKSPSPDFSRAEIPVH